MLTKCVCTCVWVCMRVCMRACVLVCIHTCVHIITYVFVQTLGNIRQSTVILYFFRKFPNLYSEFSRIFLSVCPNTVVCEFIIVLDVVIIKNHHVIILFFITHLYITSHRQPYRPPYKSAIPCKGINRCQNLVTQ